MPSERAWKKLVREIAPHPFLKSLFTTAYATVRRRLAAGSGRVTIPCMRARQTPVVSIHWA